MDDFYRACGVGRWRVPYVASDHRTLEGEVYFLQSNPDYTITEPGSTVSGMTVGYYNGDDNSIAIRSGRGYTRSEKIKPDFVAPGVNVTGAAMRNQFTERYRFQCCCRDYGRSSCTYAGVDCVPARGEQD